MYWKNVSIPAKQLIASLLNTDPKYRMTAQGALDTATWLKIESNRLMENDLSASLSEFQKFDARRSLKSAARAVLWSVKTRFKSADAVTFAKQMNEWNKDDEAKLKDEAAKSRVDNALLSSLRPTLTFKEVYDMEKKMHASSTASIWSCKHKQSGTVFAVKVVEKKKDNVGAGSKSVSEAVFHELAVLKSVKHPKISEIIDFFEEDEGFYLVMELMEGGDVFDRILSLKHYTEKDARDLIRLLLDTVSFIHSRGIAHRDLKPQNILLKVRACHCRASFDLFGLPLTCCCRKTVQGRQC